VSEPFLADQFWIDDEQATSNGSASQGNGGNPSVWLQCASLRAADYRSEFEPKALEPRDHEPAPTSISA
jgi:hypothetical protein